jgi:hypothetical protein
MKRQAVGFFVSYARANKALALRFLTRFEEQLTPSRHYAYHVWRDGRILVGEDWHGEIQRALHDCQLGLLLISPAFLGSQYIERHELPTFVGQDAKPIIPIMLQPVDFERHDLKGLGDQQIFRLDGERFKEPKAYGECSGNQRERFAAALFRQVEQRLDKGLVRKERRL